MTAPACNCPVPPALDEMSAEQLDRIIGRPLRCMSCGEELELRCPEGHVHRVRKTISPNIRRAPKPLPPERRRKGPRQPAERRCLKCGTVKPPRKSRCLACRPIEVRPPKTQRIYPSKSCACGAVFQPTGPNSKRCPDCKART